jgi:uncharacterized membrane protein YidH (DUF202 family)
MIRYLKNNEGNDLTSETPAIDDKMYQSNMRTSLAFIRTVDAEKRTHLAELRTGIGILTIPMSLLTILIATSNYYHLSQVFGLVVALIAGIVVLFFIGGFLVYSALPRLRDVNKLRLECDDLSCLISKFNGDE